MMSDFPRIGVPLDGVFDSENVFLYNDRGETRPGTMDLNANQASLPAIGTGISASKVSNVITISSGYSPSSSNEGDYFVWPDDGKHEFITSVSGSDLTVISDRTHSACTTGKIRQELNAAIWDSVNDKHVILLGTVVYYAAWNCASWTEVYCLSVTAPANTKSIMRQVGENIYLWNSNGKFVIRMGADVPTVSKINNTMIECPISDVGETDTLKYGRRYTCTMIEMLGNYLTDSYGTNEIELESSPWKLDSDGKDYCEIFAAKPIGDGSTYTYQTLTGVLLDINTVSDFASVSDGQAKFTINGETRNIVVDFTGVFTWADVAQRIETALKAYWSYVSFTYSDEREFTLSAGAYAGATVDYCESGDGGTDISGETGVGSAALTRIDSVGAYTEHFRHVFGDGTFIYVGCSGDGIWVFSVNSNGFLTRHSIYNEGASDYYYGVWSDGSFVYVALGYDGIRSFSVDGSGNLTKCDTQDDGGGVEYHEYVWGDGTFVYVSLRENGIRSYSVDGSGNFTLQDTQDDGGTYYGIWGDGTYIYVACGGDGLRSYSVDGSGNFTLQDTQDDGGTYYGIWGDGTYIYVACGDDGLRSYSVDGSGNFTLVDSDDQGGVYNAIWGNGSNLFIGYNGIKVYTTDGSGNLTYSTIWEEDGGYSLWHNGTYLIAATGLRGLRVYNFGTNYYLRMDSSNGTITSYVMKDTTSIGNLQVPYFLSGGYYSFSQEYTHYRLYGTKDIGENGIDPTTGKGNDTELYIHIADIPIIKSFVVSTAADGTVTASKGTFNKYDVDSTLNLSDGKSGTIETYTSSSVVTWSRSDVTTDVGATIGTDIAFVFSQSGYDVTAEKGSPFSSDSVGRRIFASDGTLIIITEFIDYTHVTVADSATRSSLGGGILRNGNYGSVPSHNRRKYTDTVDDETLSTRISKAWLKNRFWEPLPNCDIGIEIDGFLISAVKGNKKIYETQLANEYFAGYYDPEFQTSTVQDAIKALRVYPNALSAICSHSTVTWDTEITADDQRPDVGLYVTFLAQKKTVDYTTGTKFPDSIVSVDEGIDILVTNDSEIRLFNGKNYGPNIIDGKMMKKLRKLQSIGAVSYDNMWGYLLFGTESSLQTIDSIDRLPFPDVFYRFSIKESQGAIGGIRITGSDWVTPTTGVNGYEITDGNNKLRQVIFDNLDGKWYWLNTYDGPSGSGLSKTFLDKDNGSGTGTEISWSLIPGADVGENPHYDIRHLVSHLSLDPYDPTNGGTSGYDGDGFRDGLEIDCTAYNSENWDTAYSTANDVTKDGDISFDEDGQAKAIQIKIAGNRSEVIINEVTNYYASIDQAAAPTKREMSEGDYQSNLKAPVLWLSRNASLYKNLATGSSISGTPTAATGVDGKSNSAFTITSALTTISVSLTSGSLIYWIKSDNPLEITIGGTTVQSQYVNNDYAGASSDGEWRMYYVTGITQSGTLIIGLGQASSVTIEDFRVYNSEIDSDTRTYLYNDMIRNNGNNTLLMW